MRGSASRGSFCVRVWSWRCGPIIRSEFGVTYWDVETDRGPARFTLDTEDDVRRISAHRVLITDSRKLRYQVPDTRTLDA